MRIVITGSHGVGKTTLISHFLEILNREEEKFKLLPETPRQAVKLGFPINENTPIETQFWIFAKQIEMEHLAKNYFIADKCFIDLLAYAIFLFPDQPEFLKVLRDIAKKAAVNYNLVIYIPSGEFPIEDDGVRSTDPKFQSEIDRLVVEILNEFGVDYTKITGNKEERYKKALELMENIVKIINTVDD
jgi:nicotinamide riboside kinase